MPCIDIDSPILPHYIHAMQAAKLQSYVKPASGHFSDKLIRPFPTRRTAGLGQCPGLRPSVVPDLQLCTSLRCSFVAAVLLMHQLVVAAAQLGEAVKASSYLVMCLIACGQKELVQSCQIGMPSYGPAGSSFPMIAACA